MGKLRTNCKYCGHVYTEQETARRVLAKKENAARSRQKAKERGVSLGRRQVAFASTVVPLREKGYSIRKIAKILGISTTPIQRLLKELR